MARKPKEPTYKPEMTENLSMQQEEMSRPEHDAYQRSRCGGALRSARENQGLTVQDIANRLRLSPKQIEAIEADNFLALPEPTIVRGFIRNYAKLLKVSMEPLLDAYSVLAPNSAPHEFTVKPTSKMKVTSYDKPKSGRYIWAGLILLAGLGAWLFYQSYIEKPSPAKPAITQSIVEPLPQAALPAAERTASPEQVIALDLPPTETGAAVTTETANQLLPADTNVNNPVAANTPPAPAPNPAPAEVTLPAAIGKSQLEFNASQETWVSVVDATGKEIFNKTIFAGSRESVEVTLPVDVVVGNAGATNMSMNGKPVNLAPHSRQNVARIKLE